MDTLAQPEERHQERRTVVKNGSEYDGAEGLEPGELQPPLQSGLLELVLLLDMMAAGPRMIGV